MTAAVSLTELREHLGVTERRATYWRRNGWIGGTPQAPRTDWTGPGYAITLTPQEAAHFRLVARLVDAGITPARASTYAWQLLDAGRAVLAPGLTIEVHA